MELANNKMKIDISENVDAKELEFNATDNNSHFAKDYSDPKEFWEDINNDINKQPNATVKSYTMDLIYISHSPGCIYIRDSQGRLRKICS
jgi:hypothetical protein